MTKIDSRFGDAARSWGEISGRQTVHACHGRYMVVNGAGWEGSQTDSSLFLVLTWSFHTTPFKWTHLKLYIDPTACCNALWNWAGRPWVVIKEVCTATFCVTQVLYRLSWHSEAYEDLFSIQIRADWFSRSYLVSLSYIGCALLIENKRSSVASTSWGVAYNLRLILHILPSFLMFW